MITKEKIRTKIQYTQSLYEGIGEFWLMYSEDAILQLRTKNTKKVLEDLDILTNLSREITNSVMEVKNLANKLTTKNHSHE